MSFAPIAILALVAAPLLADQPKPPQTLDQVAAAISQLPGKTGFHVVRLDDGKVLQSLNAETPLGIGSAFKLYVLATLIRQKTPWDKVITLEDRYKSIPTGEMQDWPAGSPVTVHTLALKMISISDNTAADHLLALAGRRNVQAALADLGHKNPSLNVPFLSVTEMMRLKIDAELFKQYLAASPEARTQMLDKLLGTPRPTTLQVALATGLPWAIDTVEWFASPADLCRLLTWYDRQNDPVALGILAINPLVNIPADKIAYAGYKGGAETGVLSMNWLLRTRDGHRYVVSAIWNNPNWPVEIMQFIPLMQTTINILATSP